MAMQKRPGSGPSSLVADPSDASGGSRLPVPPRRRRREAPRRRSRTERRSPARGRKTPPRSPSAVKRCSSAFSWRSRCSTAALSFSAALRRLGDDARAARHRLSFRAPLQVRRRARPPTPGREIGRGGEDGGQGRPSDFQRLAPTARERRFAERLTGPLAAPGSTTGPQGEIGSPSAPSLTMLSRTWAARARPSGPARSRRPCARALVQLQLAADGRAPPPRPATGQGPRRAGCGCCSSRTKRSTTRSRSASRHARAGVGDRDLDVAGGASRGRAT